VIGLVGMRPWPLRSWFQGHEVDVVKDSSKTKRIEMALERVHEIRSGWKNREAEVVYLQ